MIDDFFDPIIRIAQVIKVLMMVNCQFLTTLSLMIKATPSAERVVITYLVSSVNSSGLWKAEI